MKISNMDVDAILAKVRQQLEDDQTLSPSLRTTIELLIALIQILTGRLSTNSANSSKPPSQDPNRPRKTRSKGERKPGGQPGRGGKTLQPVEDPDAIQTVKLDRRTLPRGSQFQVVGYEKRQVIDLDISRFVTEYRAEILENAQGQRIVAPFPAGVDRPVQYGPSVKAHAVYLSQYQLLPYERIREYVEDQAGIPLSAGSLFNFNQEAFDRSVGFEHWVKDRLAESELIHADETSINIGGQRHWLHCASNDGLTWLAPHVQRGHEAMEEIGILPRFHGVLCHDHWKTYYRYQCRHALCNAHHLRELERAWEQDQQAWAQRMQTLLCTMDDAVKNAGGSLPPDKADGWRKAYRQCLKKAEDECPPPDESQRQGKRGRLKRTRARNLLERLRDYEADVLRFLDDPAVPFTNTRVNVISACSRCSRRSPAVSARSTGPGSSAACAAICRRRGSRT